MWQNKKLSCVSLFLLSGLIFVWTSSVCPAANMPSYRKCITCHEHEGLRQETMSPDAHAPFRKQQCGSCHDPHTSNYKFLIKEEVGALCKSCHTKRAEMQEVYHLPVEEGDCTSCHDPHFSKNKHLLIAKQGDLCFTCHEPESIFPGDGKHGPAKQKQCLKCHYPHGSDNEWLLVENKKKICITCHSKDLKDPRVIKAHRSYPVSGADCVSCHNPHASDKKNLTRKNEHEPFKNCTTCHNPPDSKNPLGIRKAGAKVCFDCHKGIDRDFMKINTHIANGMFCTNCHNPHVSDKSSLKKGNLTRICLACHTDSKWRMENKKTKYQHPEVKKGKCTACHDPHGSNFRLFFPDKEIAVCTTCHKRHAKFSHPVGDETVDPRSRRDITCITCHDLMGSRYEFELRFDRGKELCIQCHTSY